MNLKQHIFAAFFISTIRRENDKDKKSHLKEN